MLLLLGLALLRPSLFGLASSPLAGVADARLASCVYAHAWRNAVGWGDVWRWCVCFSPPPPPPQVVGFTPDGAWLVSRTGSTKLTAFPVEGADPVPLLSLPGGGGDVGWGGEVEWADGRVGTDWVGVLT
jgi:hypothetical protein